MSSIRSLPSTLFIVPNVCFANFDIREVYIKVVRDFSLFGNALMPSGNDVWLPDEGRDPI